MRSENILNHGLRSSPPASQPSNVIRLHSSHSHQVLCISHMGIELRELCMQMCVLPIPICGDLGDGVRSLLGGIGVGRWWVGDRIARKPVCGIGRHFDWSRPTSATNRAALLYWTSSKGFVWAEHFGKEAGRITRDASRVHLHVVKLRC